MPAEMLLVFINLFFIMRKGLSRMEANRNLKNKKVKTGKSLIAFFIIIKVEPQQRATKISKKSDRCSRVPFFCIFTISRLIY